MKWYEKIIAIHTAVTDAVRHNEYILTDRYFVWQEDGQNDLLADNQHIAKAITGTTDLFTKQEFDNWVEEFEQSLNNSGIAWRLNSIQYEEETGFYHYEWAWEIVI